MSNKLLTAVLNKAPYPAGGVRGTLIALANAADDHGRVTYIDRMRIIAKHAGIGERQCRRARGVLMRDGLLVELIPRAGKTSIWKLTLPPEWLEEPGHAPAPPASAAPPDTTMPDPLADARANGHRRGDEAYARLMGRNKPNEKRTIPT